MFVYDWLNHKFCWQSHICQVSLCWEVWVWCPKHMLRKKSCIYLLHERYNRVQPLIETGSKTKLFKQLNDRVPQVCWPSIRMARSCCHSASQLSNKNAGSCLLIQLIQQMLEPDSNLVSEQLSLLHTFVTLLANWSAWPYFRIISSRKRNISFTSPDIRINPCTSCSDE